MISYFKNLLFFGYCAVFVAAACTLQASPLSRLNPECVTKVQAFMSSITYAKTHHIFSLLSKQKKKATSKSKVKVQFILPPSKAARRYAQQESSEKKCSFDKEVPSNEPAENWRHFISKHFENPDVLFRKTRTLLFLQSYAKRTPLVLEVLRKKPIFLTLYPALMQRYDLDFWDNLLQYQQVYFLPTPQLLCNHSAFFESSKRVSRVAGIVSDATGCEYDSVLDAQYAPKARRLVYQIDHPLWLRHAEFLTLLEHKEKISEHLPNFWEYILGLFFQDASPQCLEDKATARALIQCRFLRSFSWRFGDNIRKNYEESAFILKEADPVHHPFFCFYEHFAQKGREIFVEILPHLKYLKNLDISDWFLHKNMNLWCYKLLQNLFLLPQLEAITLPVSLFEDKRFFATILGCGNSVDKLPGFFSRLTTLRLNFESEPLEPAKKIAELSSYLEKNPGFHQIPSAFYQGIAMAEGIKELSFFLTRPWIQKKLSHLSIDWLCFNLQNCLMLGNDKALFLASHQAQGWLKNYSIQESLIAFKNHDYGLYQLPQKDFHQNSGLIKKIMATDLHFPFALQGLQNLKSVQFGEVFAYDESIDGQYANVPGKDHRLALTQSAFLKAVSQGITSWGKALVHLPKLQQVTIKDHSLLQMLCLKEPLFPFERVRVAIQKSSFRLQNIFYSAPGLSFPQFEITTYAKMKGNFDWDRLLERFLEQPHLLRFVTIKTFVLNYLSDYKAARQWIKLSPSFSTLNLHLKSDFEGSAVLPPMTKVLYQDPKGKVLELPDYDAQESYWIQKANLDFTLNAQSLCFQAAAAVPGLIRFSAVCEADSLLFLLLQSFPFCQIGYLRGPIAPSVFFKNWLRNKIPKEKCLTLFYNDQLVH